MLENCGCLLSVWGRLDGLTYVSERQAKPWRLMTSPQIVQIMAPIISEFAYCEPPYMLLLGSPQIQLRSFTRRNGQSYEHAGIHHPRFTLLTGTTICNQYSRPQPRPQRL